MVKVERFQVHALKWLTHFNLSFKQVCDFPVTATGKAVPELSGLDGASHSAMENKNNYGMPETARVGHTEKDLMGSLGCSGSIRIKYKSEVKIQWKKIRRKLLLSFCLALWQLTLVLPHWAIQSLGKGATASLPLAKLLTQPQKNTESRAGPVLARRCAG